MSSVASQLRDIHLPEPVGWWPPAPGWWMVLGLTLLLTAVGAWWAQRRRQRRWLVLALAELTSLRRAYHAGELSADEVTRALSVLLRRVAITRYPRSGVAALTGVAWLEFLDCRLGGGEAFGQGVGRALTHLPYRPPGSASADDTPALFDLVERWLKSEGRGK